MIKLRRPSATSSPPLRAASPGSDEARVADLYASFMDEEAVEQAGADPIMPLLAAIDSVGTLSDLTRMLGGFARQAVPGLVGLQAEPDPGDPNRYVMFAGQGGLGLPDEEYYRLEEYAEIRAQYRHTLRHPLRLLALRTPTARRNKCSILRPISPRRTGTR